jgi:hypothetical protein
LLRDHSLPVFLRIDIRGQKNKRCFQGHLFTF